VSERNMKTRWKLPLLLLIGGSCVPLVLPFAQAPRSLGIGSTIWEVDDYLAQETSRDHGFPFIRGTLYSGCSNNGRLEIFTRFGLRRGHYPAVRYQVLMQESHKVVGMKRGWIWTWDL